MRILVIGYSWTGNNRVLAGALAERLGATVTEVTEAKRRRGFTIALDLLLRRRPAIRPLDVSAMDGDHVVLVAPIWAGQVAHPLQTWLREHGHALPAYSFITFCGNGPASQRARIEQQLSVLTGQRPQQVMQLPLAERLPEAKRSSVRAVSNYRATAEDVRYFQGQIDAFCEAIAPVHRAPDPVPPPARTDESRSGRSKGG